MPNPNQIKFYRKARKLLREPRAFFHDSSVIQQSVAAQRIASWLDRSPAPKVTEDSPQLAYVWGVRHSKHKHIVRCFPEYRMVFEPSNRTVRGWAKGAAKGSVCIVWGYREPAGLVERAKELGVEVWRMEEGLLGSKGVGATKTASHS